MKNVGSGIIAGFVATAVLSIIMIIKSAAGLLPELNIIQMLSGMLSGAPVTGWIAHFAIGAVLWGTVFAIFNNSIPGNSQIAKGIVLGIVAWLLMMVIVMPMAGAGVFGLNIGIMAPVMTLILHLVYGAVLGWVYAMNTMHRQTV